MDKHRTLVNKSVKHCILRLYVGYQKDAKSAIVEVKEITHNEGIVEYYLGRILEHIQQELSVDIKFLELDNDKVINLIFTL